MARQSVNPLLRSARLDEGAGLWPVCILERLLETTVSGKPNCVSPIVRYLIDFITRLSGFSSALDHLTMTPAWIGTLQLTGNPQTSRRRSITPADFRAADDLGAGRGSTQWRS
jgi:hypothetical protein